MKRRDLMKVLPAAALSSRLASAREQKKISMEGGLPLEQFEPKSMLHAKETRVPRSRYPVIDFHTYYLERGTDRRG